jgi:hypothetical protein
MPDQGYLQVVATLDSSVDRDDFEQWYDVVHVPQVISNLGAKTARRMWSLEQPTVHYAFYEFESTEFLITQLSSPEMLNLIREFDARWGDSVKRERTAMRGAAFLIA